jgi:sugar phosphate isomerase/epimerase
MKLGMISGYDLESLSKVSQLGLRHVEFCINHHEDQFLESLETVEKSLKTNQLSVFSVGRWGTSRIHEHGIDRTEFEKNCRLIDAAARLHAPVFVTGVNYVDALSYEDNLAYAVAYLKELHTYAQEKKIELAVYNCRWGNFIIGPDTWDVVLKAVPGLGIKYDPSHAIYDLKNYLKEINDYGPYIKHIHLKGSLLIDNVRVDDPPAGLDMTDWKSFMAILYKHHYQGGLSIEPHSSTWTGDLGAWGIRYSILYFKPLICEVKS